MVFVQVFHHHKNLSNLPSDVASQVYNNLDPSQQQTLQKNFGNEDPALKPNRGWLGTAWHYTGGQVANALGYVGSKTLAGLGNVSDAMTRAYRTAAIAIDQDVPLFGAGNAFDIANDKGDKRIAYIIFDGKIMSPILGWKRRAYKGANPHRSHLHISFTILGDKDGSYFNLEGEANERVKEDGRELGKDIPSNSISDLSSSRPRCRCPSHRREELAARPPTTPVYPTILFFMDQPNKSDD